MDASGSPQLRRIRIEINRRGHLVRRGLAVCPFGSIEPATTREALQHCGAAQVGVGSFSADVKLPAQSPFPTEGRLTAFNGRFEGKPAILAHIFGTDPAPTSYVLPFRIRRSQGTFGTVLEASLSQSTGDWGYVTGISMTLRRRFSFRGRSRSFLIAGCPAPARFSEVRFPLVRTGFAFAGGLSLTTTVSRGCEVRG